MARLLFALLLTTYAIGSLSAEAQTNYVASNAIVPEGDFIEMMPPVLDSTFPRRWRSDTASAAYHGSDMYGSDMYGNDIEDTHDSPHDLPTTPVPVKPGKSGRGDMSDHLGSGPGGYGHHHFHHRGTAEDGHEYHGTEMHGAGDSHPDDYQGAMTDKSHFYSQGSVGDFHGSDMYGSDMYANDIHDTHDSPPPPAPVAPHESGSGDMSDHLGSGPGGYGHHHFHHRGTAEDGHEYHGTEMHGAGDSHPDDYQGAMDSNSDEDSSQHHKDGNDPCASKCGSRCMKCIEPCNVPLSAACQMCVTEEQCQTCYNCHMHAGTSGAGEHMPGPGSGAGSGAGSYSSGAPGDLLSWPNAQSEDDLKDIQDMAMPTETDDNEELWQDADTGLLWGSSP